MLFNLRPSGAPRLRFACAFASLALLSAGALSADEQDFVLGATTHFRHGKGVVAENLKAFEDGGLRSPRDDASWYGVERRKGVYSFDGGMYGQYLELAAKKGLSPLQVIGYGNPNYDDGGYPKSPEAVEAFAKYAEAVVLSGKGKIRLYQLWNEWDGVCGMPKRFHGQGDAKSYARLAAASYPRMKAADPGATIIANSVCTGELFLEDILAEGILKNCDGVAFHAYNYDKLGADRGPEAFFERIAGVDKLLRRYNGGKEFPIYLTEIGWPNHVSRSGSTEQESGDSLARMLFLCKTLPSIKGVWWYDFQDDGLNPALNEDNFGLVRPDLTPKEPYYVLRSISKIVAKAKFAGAVKTPEASLIALKFKMPDSQDVLVAWSSAEEGLFRITLKNSLKAKGPLLAFFAGFEALERDWGARDWTANSNAPFQEDRFQFTVKGRPYILMGDLRGVEVESVRKLEFPEIQKPKKTVRKVPALVGEARSVASNSPKVYRFGGPLDYRSLVDKPQAGPDGLDAAFSLSWEKDAFILNVEVSDKTLFQKDVGANMWKGDSVQVAFQRLGSSSGSDDGAFSEYLFALVEKGPEAYREFSQIKLPEGSCDAVRLEARREGAKTFYSARIPFKELGFEGLKPDAPFGFSILVNDNDGAGREGYLHWGDGIGNGKNPYDYNWMTIKE